MPNGEARCTSDSTGGDHFGPVLRLFEQLCHRRSVWCSLEEFAWGMGHGRAAMTLAIFSWLVLPDLAPSGAALLDVTIFNFSWSPVMWVMLGEMFSSQIRGTGLPVSGFAPWVANLGITMTFPMMLAGVGLGGAYAVYAVCAFISIFLCR